VVVLYRESHAALDIKVSFSPDMPQVDVDPTRSSGRC
jgi:hypothetical protein